MRRQLVFSVAVFLGVVGPVFSLMNLIHPSGMPATIAGFAYAAWTWSVVLQLGMGVSSRLCAQQLLTGFVLCLTVVSFCMGGVLALPVAWVAFAPALGLTMDGPVVAIRSGILSVGAILFLGVMTGMDWVYPMVLVPDLGAVLFTLNALSMAFILIVLGRTGERMNQAARDALQRSNDVLSQEVSDHEQTRDRLNRTHLDVVAAAHIAGAAQMATGILHNLGNALNAVLVSTGLAEAQLGSMRVNRVEALADLIEPQVGEKASQYSRMLAADLEASRTGLREELRGIRQSVEHAVAIVSTQQRHAVRTSVTERVKVSEVLADALSLSGRVDSSVRVEVLCEDLPMVVIDRHRVLQIVTNLVTNAYDALSASDDGWVLVNASSGLDGELVVTVTDNGKGIDSEDLKRVFAHGFTTREDGHGFGLHASAIAAQELGGALATYSAGLGLGACFTLSIPSPWDESDVGLMDQQRHG